MLDELAKADYRTTSEMLRVILNLAYESKETIIIKREIKLESMKTIESNNKITNSESFKSGDNLMNEINKVNKNIKSHLNK